MKVLSLASILTVGILLQACGGGGSGSSTKPPVMSSVQSSSSSSAPMSSSASTSKASSSITAGGFAKGADVSWVTEMEAANKKFYNKAGVQKDLFEILKEQGMDTIRLRVWVNPTGSPKYNDKADVLAKAKRARDAGMRLMIDFHYSDTWADPDSQAKPAAWSGYNVDQLAAAVAEHTKEMLVLLRDSNITPEWVQIGNETNDGMLWPEGRASTNMANYARFVKSGYDAVKEIFSNTLVIVHRSNCFENADFRWNIGGLKANGGKFDVIGASNYPSYRTGISWQKTNEDCLANLNDMVATYNVPVMIVEAGLPMNQSDGKAAIADLISKVRSISNNKGLGVLYWEPQAYGGWASNYGLGAFDNTGKPTATLDAFLE